MHVILVHGAGLDAAAFTRTRTALEQEECTVTVPTRRGYDERPATADLDVHVDDLLALVTGSVDRDVVLAGVSGGATLALAAALRPDIEVRAVVHEPLLGPAAPAQHEVITTSIETFRRDGDVDGFLRRLHGETWDRLDPACRDRAVGHAATVRTEVDGFAGFRVDDALDRVAARVVWTVGGRSPAWRHEAAAVAEGAGIAVRKVDAVHTPQVEDPAGWAAVVAGAAR